MTMIDVQSRLDHRNIPIDQVGIRALRHPFLLVDGKAPPQPAVGLFTLLAGLSSEQKGTHMSRFVEFLTEQHSIPLSLNTLPYLVETLTQRLKAPSAYLEVITTYFLPKAAPVSGSIGLLDYELKIVAEKTIHGTSRFYIKIIVPITTLCPCSKEISEQGAHNQRAHVTAWVAFDPLNAPNLKELIRLIEQEASCEIFPILKRADEKWITEHAYTHPKFVEDLIRDVATQFSHHKKIQGYQLSCESFESIHNHSAYAFLQHNWPGMDSAC